jgi:outer membrane lipoprotein LolB
MSLKRGNEALAGNFRWRHDELSDQIDFSSPMGQTLARLSGGTGGVLLETSDGRTLAAPDWAALSSQAVSWALPVSGMQYWIQGIPRPGAPFSAERDATGQATMLRQDGWTIAYAAYARDGVGPHPTRMTLDYPDVEVRVVVDTWQ